LPWLAAFFLRDRRLRDFFAIVDSSRLVAQNSAWLDSGMAEEIRAEMVANVWKVVASAGAQVDEGDTLVILESMKMEIPVLAESGGTVSQLAVNEGDVVQEGDLIAVIE
jgi:acetyl-CoA carboxylase biotin carboxyl carrier protein